MTFVPFVKVRRAKHDEDFETWESGRPAPTLNAMDNNGDTHATVLIPTAFLAGNSPNGGLDAIETAPTLDTRSWQGPRRNQAAIAIVTSFRGDNINGWRDGVGPLRAMGGDLGGGSETLVVPNRAAVRRLTPLECERLMGWPDGWTAEGINGPIADSHRYRMCGNGVVANVTEWIGRRL